MRKHRTAALVLYVALTVIATGLALAQQPGDPSNPPTQTQPGQNMPSQPQQPTGQQPMGQQPPMGQQQPGQQNQMQNPMGTPDTSGLTPTESTAKNVTDLKFANIPDLPTCAMGSPTQGDPNEGAFIAAMKAKRGCTIPWHWHSASETLVIVSGQARVEMREGGDTKTPATGTTVKAGAFVAMPAQHVHQFRCMQTCSLYLISDGKFDIHYVNPEGNELSPDEALKPLKETATSATAMK